MHATPPLWPAGKQEGHIKEALYVFVGIKGTIVKSGILPPANLASLTEKSRWLTARLRLNGAVCRRHSVPIVDDLSEECPQL
jgi:hypothetical protein